jgi:hypothetical protein
VVLVLDEDLGADELGQAGVRVERRPEEMRADHEPRGEHVGQGGDRPPMGDLNLVAVELSHP